MYIKLRCWTLGSLYQLGVVAMFFRLSRGGFVFSLSLYVVLWEIKLTILRQET